MVSSKRKPKVVLSKANSDSGGWGLHCWVRRTTVGSIELYSVTLVLSSDYSIAKSDPSIKWGPAKYDKIQASLYQISG